jgi:hypothetical protein
MHQIAAPALRIGDVSLVLHRMLHRLIVDFLWNRDHTGYQRLTLVQVQLKSCILSTNTATRNNPSAADRSAEMTK